LVSFPSDTGHARLYEIHFLVGRSPSSQQNGRDGACPVSPANINRQGKNTIYFGSEQKKCCLPYQTGKNCIRGAESAELSGNRGCAAPADHHPLLQVGAESAQHKASQGY